MTEMIDQSGGNRELPQTESRKRKMQAIGNRTAQVVGSLFTRFGGEPKPLDAVQQEALKKIGVSTKQKYPDGTPAIEYRLNGEQTLAEGLYDAEKRFEAIQTSNNTEKLAAAKADVQWHIVQIREAVKEVAQKHNEPTILEPFGPINPAYYTTMAQTEIRQKFGITASQEDLVARAQLFDNFYRVKTILELNKLQDTPVDSLTSLREAIMAVSPRAKIELGNPPTELGYHTAEITENAKKLFLTQEGQSRFPQLFTNQEAQLLPIAAAVHDLAKYLGPPNAQVTQDHEVLMAQLIREHFGNTFGPNDIHISPIDAQKIADTVFQHENINKPDMKGGRRNWITSPNLIHRMDAAFFVLDTLTGVINPIDDNPNVFAVDIKKLNDRFTDLAQRHADYTKAFLPEWVTNSVLDLVTTLTVLQNNGLQISPDDKGRTIQEIVFDAGITALQQARHTGLNTQTNSPLTPSEQQQLQKAQEQLQNYLLSASTDQAMRAPTFVERTNIMVTTVATESARLAVHSKAALPGITVNKEKLRQAFEEATREASMAFQPVFDKIDHAIQTEDGKPTNKNYMQALLAARPAAARHVLEAVQAMGMQNVTQEQIGKLMDRVGKNFYDAIQVLAAQVGQQLPSDWRKNPDAIKDILRSVLPLDKHPIYVQAIEKLPFLPDSPELTPAEIQILDIFVRLAQATWLVGQPQRAKYENDASRINPDARSIYMWYDYMIQHNRNTYSKSDGEYEGIVAAALVEVAKDLGLSFSIVHSI